MASRQYRRIFSFFQLSAGILTLLSFFPLSMSFGQNFPFREYSVMDGLPQSQSTGIIQDSRGFLWITTRNGISRFDGVEFKNYFRKDGLPSNVIGEVTEDKEGIIWALTTDGASRYDGYRFRFFPYSENEELRNLFTGKLSSGKITNDGGVTDVSGYNSGQDDYIRISNGGITSVVNLPFNFTGLLIDNESNLWFSSERNIFKLISTAFSDIIVIKGLVSDAWAMAEDRNGHIWFGSLFGDLEEFDGRTFRIRNDYKRTMPGITSFYKGSIRRANGDIYFSTNRGVLIWNGTSFSILRQIPDGTQVCIIYEDPVDKSLLFGTDRGLYHLRDGNMKLYPELDTKGFGVIEGIVRSNDGKYWLSGEKGLVILDGKNISPVKDPVLPGGYTFTLVEDYRGGLWVTSEEGLFYRDNSSGAFRNGLPEMINSTANSIILMDSLHIMIGRMTDICIIDLEKFYNNLPDYFRIFDKSEGFTGSDCLDNGIIRDKKGKFWILTSDRVVIFDPQRIRTNNLPPRTFLTGIDYETDSLTWDPVIIPGLFYGKHGDIRLTRKQKSIRISFTGISLTNPEKVRYQYRLLGRDDVWSEPGYGRAAIFENLPPRLYTFELKSFNAGGFASRNPVSLSFRVLPEFWQTLVFKIVSILSGILLVAVLTWLVVKRYLKQKSEEEHIRSELARLQMNSVIRQFDPHFTFNVISSVGSLIMKGEKETAYDYILKLSGLLRTTLGEGSVIIRTISDELDFVRKYCDLQKLRFRERFSCSLEVGENVDLQRKIPKMTIQTFIENSIKHGIEPKKEGGTVSTKIEQKDGFLVITVLDNGIGREAAKAGNTRGVGYGINTLNNILDFLNKLNRTRARIEITNLYDDRNNPGGTQVMVFIPDDYIFEFGKSADV